MSLTIPSTAPRFAENNGHSTCIEWVAVLVVQADLAVVHRCHVIGRYSEESCLGSEYLERTGT